MESSFAIIADASRRSILDLLCESERSVGDLEAVLDLPQPTVSKHLRVLRDAGFVEARVDAQRRIYRLRMQPLQEIDAWVGQFRRIWSKHLDALESFLDSEAAADREVPSARASGRRKARVSRHTKGSRK
jgi:DNA-binding transcriptional ArsR family regulator